MHIDDLAKQDGLIWATYVCTNCLDEALIASFDGGGSDDIVKTMPCKCGYVGQYKRVVSDADNNGKN